MFPLDRVVVGPDGLALVGDVPALSPLPSEFRDPAAAEDRRHLGAVGLSLAAATASLPEYRLLRRALRPHVAGVTMTGGRVRRTLVAAAVSGVAAGVVRPAVADLAPVVAGVAAVGVAGVVYLAVAWRLGVPECRQVLGLLGRHR